MYPKVDNTEASPVTPGFPVNIGNQVYPPPNAQVYPPSNPPAFQTEATKGPVPWSTGLCDCFEDTGNCCITCFCPCITFGQIAEIVDRGSSSCGASGALYTLLLCLTGCQCIYSCAYRSKMRGQYTLHESPCNDCLVHCCCEACALCQEYRELKTRGFDMNIGWQANMERRAAGAMDYPPAVPHGMSR